MNKKLFALILTALLALGLVVSASAASEAVYEGIGTTFTFRLNGSGSSFYNTAFAFVQFDADGRIVDSYIDVLEIADPTVSMASCPRYAVVGQTMDWYDLETKEVKQAEVTADMASELVSAWRTKRERGHEYGMGGAGEWFEQMDAYQAFFKGKTVEELKAWGENGLDENGKPVEAISGATMSVNDAHSDILGAVLKAWDNRTDYIACDKEGYGFTYTFRLNGSGSSFYNVAFSRVKLDENGKIIANDEDVLEICDPTVSMASCPRYAVVGDTMNWYNLDTKETAPVEVTADMAGELVAAWRTKRGRGSEYGMGGAGEWFEQMNAYQAFFNGKTAEELKAWGESGLDENGKPVEAISGATMSVNDAHSDILGAVLKACENAK